MQTGKKKLIKASIHLSHEMIDKWPEITQLALCLNQLAESYGLIKDHENAIMHYEKCIQNEEKFPNIRTSAILDLPEYIVKNKLTSYYNKALSILEIAYKRQEGFSWPLEYFMYHGLKSAIYFYYNFKEKAIIEKNEAEKYSKTTKSWFRYHKKLGVTHSHHWLIKKLNKIPSK
jgi:tetratricopeptide (TPR) repeat protein